MVCIECKKNKKNVHEIVTRRKTKIIICTDCIKKYQRKEGSSARDSI